MSSTHKRDRRLSVGTMNPLDEEDESTALSESNDFNETTESSQVNTESTSVFNKTVEQEKLNLKIDTVFKSLPPCDQVVDLNKDNKRLDALEQLLIDRFVYDRLPQTPRPPVTINADRPHSAAAYSSSFTVSYLSQENIDTTPKDPFQPNILNLNNLQLTHECVKNFSKESLMKKVDTIQGTESINNSARSDISSLAPSTQQSPEITDFIKNAKLINTLNFNRNKLSLLPTKILDMFRKVEVVDLSENNFETVELCDFVSLTKLIELNLSSNLLTELQRPEESDADIEARNKILADRGFLKSMERLNVSNNRLNGLNTMCVNQLENLKSLNLSNNEFQLNPLANDFYQMPWQSNRSILSKLEELDLSKNNKNPQNDDFDDPVNNQSSSRAGSVSSVMSNHSSMYSATTRKKSNSRLIRNTYYFNRLANLKILNLSENNLHNMPCDIKDLRNLEELYLDNNFLEFLPNELTGLRMLKVLSVSGNKITEVNKSFCETARFRTSLQKLNLGGNKLKNSTFTYKLAIFYNMTHLDLSENLFELVPNPLPKNLTELNLNKNIIKSLMIIPMSKKERTDSEILKALGLKEKQRSQNFEDSLIKKSFMIDETMYDEPDIDKSEELQLPHVFFLRQLRRLLLTDNLISEIPADFGILNSKLEFIDLSKNQLTQVDLSLCRGLVGLKYLNLRANQIRTLPDKIRELSDLEYLNLSHNLLVSLNYELCNSLKNLQELHLNNNEITSLLLSPIKKRSVNRQLFGQSTNSQVSEFQTASSASMSIPAPIKFTFNLPTLKRLNLSANKFSETFSIYSSFGMLPKLADLDLSSNRINYIDTDTQDDSVISFSKIDIDELGETTKTLSQPKHQLYELQTVNLSHNQICFNKGGFIAMLCDLSRLAPNLNGFIFDQKNGAKLRVPETDLDDNYYFEFDYKREIEANLIKKLIKLNLSNNGLTKIPSFIFKLENIKEIYFNGNYLKKIPTEMYQLPLENNETEFKELKRVQDEEEKEKERLRKEAEGEEDEDSDDEAEKRKKAKKKKQKFKIDPLLASSDVIGTKEEIVKLPKPPLSDHIEVLQLNSNQIEHIPENLFSSFKSLIEIKLEQNPLKDPPGHSVCISAKLTRRLNQYKSTVALKKPKLKVIEENTIALANNKSPASQKGASELKKQKLDQSPTLLLSPLESCNFTFDVEKTKKLSDTSDLNLPNLFFENENLKPLQSYMVQHKKREDMLLCNMFLIIKDTIDSKETLLKILRRLKMPMDKVDYVCKEIANNVTKNWSKIVETEYPVIRGQLSPSRKELTKRMHQYILKLQAWNLMNAWRNTFGPDAPSDELVRILKLMNSNDREDRLYQKVFKLKCSSNMFKL